MIERAVALSVGGTIDLDELPQNVRHYVPGPSGSVTELPAQGLDLEALIEDIEIKLIQEALGRMRHSQKKAAQLLGLTPRSLRYRLQKYGLGTAAETIEVWRGLLSDRSKVEIGVVVDLDEAVLLVLFEEGIERFEHLVRARIVGLRRGQSGPSSGGLSVRCLRGLSHWLCGTARDRSEAA